MEDNSPVEIKTELDNKLSSNYVQELINDSNLLITNEELTLFPDTENNFINDEETNPSNNSFLITEVVLENEHNNQDHIFSNNITEMVEDLGEIDQQNENVCPSPVLSQREDEKSDISITKDDNQSLFSKEELWDTDLEEDFNFAEEKTSTSMYIDYCAKLEVVPVKYYLQNMHKPILSIKHHGLGPQGAKALAKSLESNISVELLDLSGNWIYSVGANAMGKMLEENNFITKLVLSDNMIEDQGLSCLCNAILVNRGLRHLDLSGNQITDNGCTELSELITKSKFLLELSLSKNNIDSRGAHLLAAAIASNDILEYLDLSWNKIRGEGAVDIAKGIKENIRVKTCNLSYNGFGKEGGRALADAIRDNGALIHLNIEANRLDGDTATNIGRALTANDTLEELKLGYNNMNTSGILNLMSSLNSYDASPLKLLDLSDIPIDYEIVKVIECIQSKRYDFRCIHGLEICVGNSVEDIKKRFSNFKNPIILLKNHILIKDKRLIDILLRIDVDKNNFVTLDQFAEALQELNVPFTKSQITEIQSRLDKLRNGTIYYGDFIPPQATESINSSEDIDSNEIITND